MVMEPTSESQDNPPAGPGLAGESAYLPQTTVDTMARIAAGVDPWIAFRDFLEDWTYLPASRIGLAAQRPPFANEEERRWATLLAAATESLCTRDGLVPPGWTREPAFRLSEAWYLYEGTGRIRDWLRETTPPAFSSRNIWSGDRLVRRT
jgi:hypothetical protein